MRAEISWSDCPESEDDGDDFEDESSSADCIAGDDSVDSGGDDCSDEDCVDDRVAEPSLKCGRVADYAPLSAAAGTDSSAAAASGDSLYVMMARLSQGFNLI